MNYEAPKSAQTRLSLLFLPRGRREDDDARGDRLGSRRHHAISPILPAGWLLALTLLDYSKPSRTQRISQARRYADIDADAC